MNQNPVIFDRKHIRSRRNRAADAFEGSDFLLRELAARMSDRLLDFTRTFPMALDLGAHNGLLAEYVDGVGGIETLVQADLSQDMIASAEGLRVVADEEFLPFAPASFDLVMSVGSLHWVNDIPGTLIQIQRILKPGGLFLAMLPGGETLKELRESFEQAEMSISGGISPRVSPFLDVRDGGSLLQRAGFSLPVTDSDILAVMYEHPLKLLQDLRAMGETNALISRAHGFLRRSVFAAALDYYAKHFSDETGRVRASFEVVTLAAWKLDA